MKVRVENMVSPRSGREVANQFIMYIDGVKYFQSYNTVIAKIENGKTYLDLAWNYSRTTGKYRNQFLNMTTEETRKAIKNGEIVVTSLN
jgi:hypothetical protein